MKPKRFMAGGLSDLLGQAGQTPAQGSTVAINLGQLQPNSPTGQTFQQTPASQSAQQQTANLTSPQATKLKKGGAVKAKKARGCGCATRGLTKGRMVK